MDDAINSELSRPRPFDRDVTWSGRFWHAEPRWHRLIVDLVEYRGTFDMHETTGRRLTLTIIGFWLLCRRVSKARRAIGRLPQARAL